MMNPTTGGENHKRAWPSSIKWIPKQIEQLVIH